MAQMLPETIRRTATAGERLLFNTLKATLPDDYLVYYEPEVHGRRPDFVIIGPDLGLVVLEVKDYTRSTLFEINQDEWVIRDSSGCCHTLKSPLRQARDYARHITNYLKKDDNLIQKKGPYQDHLKFPYGFGTVFTRLYQEDFVRDNLYQVIPPEFVLCRDEIDPDDENFSTEILQEKIAGMFTTWSNRNYRLTQDDIRAIRYHLFPEVRISAEFREPVYYQDQLLLSLHNIKTMDVHQENMARTVGDKHRLIRGVAGSGKTLVLASRAKMLAKEHPDWSILVLCFGITLSRTLKQMIDLKMQEPEDLIDLITINEQSEEGHSIAVFNFHEWLRDVLKTNEEQIPTLIDKLEKSEMILPRYDAILIDEGQDFEAEWLKLLVHMLNPSTQSLLLVEDRAQSIFKRKSSLIQDTGLDFRGRSKILTINYRNTAQIVQFTWDFFQQHSKLQNKVREGTIEGMEIIPPQSTKRKGPKPFIQRCHSFQDELVYVVERIRDLHEHQGVPYSEIVILYRVKKLSNISYIDQLINILKKEKLPYYWITENAYSKRSFQRHENTIKISTIDSAKGLDFRAVFIVNIENMPFYLEEEKEREVSLFYIGMTRALEFLYLTYSGDSDFTLYLDEIRNDDRVKGNYKEEINA